MIDNKTNEHQTSKNCILLVVSLVVERPVVSFCVDHSILKEIDRSDFTFRHLIFDILRFAF